jgi:hypothetical protein
MGVDQPGQHEAVGQVDQPRARGDRHKAVLHRLDPAVADEDAGIVPRRLAGPVEQGACVDDGQVCRGRRAGACVAEGWAVEPAAPDRSIRQRVRRVAMRMVRESSVGSSRR